MTAVIADYRPSNLTRNRDECTVTRSVTPLGQFGGWASISPCSAATAGECVVTPNVSTGGWHTLPSEVRSKEFSGAASLCAVCKGCGF